MLLCSVAEMLPSRSRALDMCTAPLLLLPLYEQSVWL
jgi:hypothetical protein